MTPMTPVPAGVSSSSRSAAAGPEPSGELPLLDPAYLDRLRELEEASGRSVVAEVVDSFLGEAPRRIARMREVLTAGDGEALAFTAHSLKGGSAQLGATRLAALSHKLELQAREKVLGEASKSVDEIEREIERLAPVLRQRSGAVRVSHA